MLHVYAFMKLLTNYSEETIALGRMKMVYTSVEEWRKQSSNV